MRQPPGRLPVPFGRFDEDCLVTSACSLALWVAVPDELPTGAMMLAAAAFNFARLFRWAGERTISDRLILVLHVGYFFVPAGFLLNGVTTLGLVSATAGIHAWTAGAIGMMTLAVMSRASLGHAGRELIASPALQAVYAAATIAAVARVCAAVHPQWDDGLPPVATLAWAGAFLGFATLYAPLFFLPKRKMVQAAP